MTERKPAMQRSRWGVVNVVGEPGRPVYVGSRRNDIGSRGFGAYDHSIRFVRRLSVRLPPYGPVVGEGKIANNILVLAYVIKASNTAYLEISADGDWLQGQYGYGVTNEVEMVVLQRSS